MSDLWNAIYKEEEAMLKHTIKLNTRKTIVIIYTLTTLRFMKLSNEDINFILSSLIKDD